MAAAARFDCSGDHRSPPFKGVAVENRRYKVVSFLTSPNTVLSLSLVPDGTRRAGTNHRKKIARPQRGPSVFFPDLYGTPQKSVCGIASPLTWREGTTSPVFGKTMQAFFAESTLPQEGGLRRWRLITAATNVSTNIHS